MSNKSKSPKFSLDWSLRFLEGDIKHRTDLTVDEWKVISFIHPDNSIRQIAKSTQMSTARMQSIVKHLLDLGIVEIFSDTKDLALNHEKSPASSFTYTNKDTVQDILADWHLRVVKKPAGTLPTLFSISKSTLLARDPNNPIFRGNWINFVDGK